MASRIDLYASESAGGADLRLALEDAGFAVDLLPLARAQNANGSPATLVLVDGSHETEPALRACHHLRSHHGDNYVPILYVTGDSSPTGRLASLECGADTYLLRPFDAAELLAQVHALLRIKERHDNLTARTQEVHRINKRLQAAYQQIDMELELARRIQESFLPQSLPSLPQVRFAVKYRPCGRVGGDFYDVFRLDEQHLGFYVADAMGHGVPASLLTVFVKTTVRPKEITGQTYRLVPPNEVLGRLNHELIAQKLSDNPFITLIYALYNMKERTLRFSRAGHPYPLYVPRSGPPQLWQIEGSLLGVFDTEYRLRTDTLQPGDKLILYTDGMDGAGFESLPTGTTSLLAAAERFARLSIDEMLERLAEDLFSQTQQSDDLTILGLEVSD
ncbi:MAG: SpoIIE family protein phosphatase [Gemmataceae bacterium]